MKAKTIVSWVFAALGIAAFIVGVVFAATLLSDISALFKDNGFSENVWKLVASPLLVVGGLFVALLAFHNLLNIRAYKKKPVQQAQSVDNAPKTDDAAGFEPTYRGFEQTQEGGATNQNTMTDETSTPFEDTWANGECADILNCSEGESASDASEFPPV